MENYIYKNPTKIIFGKNTVQDNLLNELKELNVKKLLITTGGGSIKRNGVYDDIMNSLKDSDIEIFEFFGIEPNPTLTNVEDAIKIVKENNIDFILSAGGGSSLDATKAISRGAKLDTNIWDVFEGKASGNGEHVPFGSIITIPATGSEANSGAVVTNDRTNEKRPSNFAHPNFSICNPEYTYTLPNWQTGAGASDIVSHIFEQYFSSSQSEITHQIMFGIIKTLKNSIPKLLEDNQNYELRAQVLQAGTYGLNYELSNGQGNYSWDVHGIEHPLSGVYKITHGAGLAVLTPNWMEMISDNSRAQELILKLGKEVFATNDVESTIESVKEMFTSFGMPTTLKELDITEDNLEFCAADAVKAWGDNFGLLHTWNKEEVLKLYKKSF